jgi:hypothetical protein
MDYLCAELIEIYDVIYYEQVVGALLGITSLCAEEFQQVSKV